MIQYKTGNAADPEESRCVIAHVVNNRGAWGKGFTASLDEIGPAPRDAYEHFIRPGNWMGDPQMAALGGSSGAFLMEGVYVRNICAQDGLGRGKRRLRYDVLASCLVNLARWLLQHCPSPPYEIFASRRRRVVMPRMGCGLAGGDWAVVEALVQDTLCREGIAVTVYDLPS